MDGPLCFRVFVPCSFLRFVLRFDLFFLLTKIVTGLLLFFVVVGVSKILISLLYRVVLPIRSSPPTSEGDEANAAVYFKCENACVLRTHALFRFPSLHYAHHAKKKAIFLGFLV